MLISRIRSNLRALEKRALDDIVNNTWRNHCAMHVPSIEHILVQHQELLTGSQ